jgi:multidrug efflux pump subunit AcrB
VRLQGKRQVYVPIYRQPGANTIAVVEGIKAQLKPILERIKGINLDVVMDQSVYVRQAIRNLVQEASLGFLLAAAMVFIFLGSARPTAIVLIALPLAVLGALIGLYFTHETLNAMTLGGIAVVIGLLIDESIVVLENTARHLDLGAPPREAALVGASEVMRPLTIVTITISVVFFPIIFISGIGKFLFTPLAKSVVFAIWTSRLLASTLVPVCAARFFKHRATKSREEHENWFERVRGRYTHALDRVLQLRWRTLGATAAFFIVSMLIFKLIGTELFPQSDAGQFTVKVRATTGLRVEKTEELVAQIEKSIGAVVPERERKMIISNIGILLDWPAAYTPNSGPQDTFILVQLAEHHARSSFSYVDELRKKLPQQFPGIEFNFDTGGMLSAALNGGLPSPINIQIEGNKLEVAHDIAEKVKRYAETLPGAVDVRIQQRLDAPQINIDIDRVKAAQVGLTQEEIVKNIVTALNSSTNFAPSFWIDEKNGNHYFIGAQYRENDIQSINTVLDIPVTGKKQPVPVALRTVAKFSRGTAYSEINHLNITRVTDVFVNVRGRDLGSVAADIGRYIDKIKNDRSQVPEGYYIQMRGEVKTMQESFKSLGFGFLLAVVLVYLVMIVEFRSFLDPFIVMFAVPLGLTGVAWMLFLTHTFLSIQSMMGIIMMVGIVVSFSVLMVDFANRILAEAADKSERKSPRDAIAEAAAIRLRPILMTGIAAVLGLTPMALFGGANIPLARAVVGGILAALVLVLFVVPVLYVLFKREKAIAVS